MSAGRNSFNLQYSVNQNAYISSSMLMPKNRGLSSPLKLSLLMKGCVQLTHLGYFSSTVLCNKYVLRLCLNVVIETFTSIFNSSTFHNRVLIFTKFVEPLGTLSKINCSSIVGMNIFVYNIQYPSIVGMNIFVYNIQYPSIVGMNIFVYNIQYPSIVGMNIFVSNIQYINYFG